MALLVFVRPRIRARCAAQSVPRNSHANRDTNDHKNIRDNRGQNNGKIQGKIEGEIKLIHTLEGILGVPMSNEADLQRQNLEELQKLTIVLQDKARNRMS